MKKTYKLEKMNLEIQVSYYFSFLNQKKFMKINFSFNKIVIVGANEVICSTLDEVMACFEAGTLLRHTGSTLMNEQSSRSHSVFTISLGI